MTIIDLAADDQLDQITSEHDWVILDFWAVWCGPCKTMASTFESLANRHQEKLKAIKANVDKLPELAANFGVRSIPTLLLFNKGEVVGQLVGAQSEAAVDSWLEKHW